MDDCTICVSQDVIHVSYALGFNKFKNHSFFLSIYFKTQHIWTMNEYHRSEFQYILILFPSPLELSHNVVSFCAKFVKQILHHTYIIWKLINNLLYVFSLCPVASFLRQKLFHYILFRDNKWYFIHFCWYSCELFNRSKNNLQNAQTEIIRISIQWNFLGTFKLVSFFLSKFVQIFDGLSAFVEHSLKTFFWCYFIIFFCGITSELFIMHHQIEPFWLNMWFIQLHDLHKYDTVCSFFLSLNPFGDMLNAEFAKKSQRFGKNSWKTSKIHNTR